ncbi:MAG: hypothetical protein QOK48_596 [Blastocatellia bacterium]|nr:hypothetical protein [Blastocatellia bacterium]
MNKKYLARAINAIVRVTPAPFIFDVQRHCWKRMDVLWRITRIERGEYVQIETLSGAQGYFLRIPYRFFHHWDDAEHYHRSFKQGQVVLRGWYLILPEGHVPMFVWKKNEVTTKQS